MKTKILTTGIFLSLLVSGLTTSKIVDNNYEKNDVFSIKQISNGENFSAVTTMENGTEHLYTWGSNEFGQLGLSTNYIDDSYNVLHEVDINGDGIYGNEGTIESVSLGNKHAAVVTKDFGDYGDTHLYTWGSNEFGQLGIGAMSLYSNKPQEVLSADEELSRELKNIVQVELGSDFSSIITNYNGKKLYTWGKNDVGQLGLGDKVNRNVPTFVSLESAATDLGSGNLSPRSISSGSDFSLMISQDDLGGEELLVWGNNSSGQLGLGNYDEYLEPEYLSTEYDGSSVQPGEFVQISAGGSSSSLINSDSEGNHHLYTWGKNDFGQLGLGTDYTLIDYNNPQLVPFFEDKKINNISLGSNFAIAKTLDSSGNAHSYSWGGNKEGQLGLGNTAIVESPEEITFFDNKGEVIRVDSGSQHSSAIILDSTDNYHLYTWGDNTQGQLGLGDGYQDSSYSSPNEITKIIKHPPLAPTITSAAVDPSSIGATTARLNYDIDIPKSNWETKSTIITKIEVIDRDNSKSYGLIEKETGIMPQGTLELTNLTELTTYETGKLIFQATWNNEDPNSSSIVSFNVPIFTTIDFSNPLSPSFASPTTLLNDENNEVIGVNYDIEIPNNGVNEPTIIEKIEIKDNSNEIYGRINATEGYPITSTGTILFENIGDGESFTNGELFLVITWNKAGGNGSFNINGDEDFGKVPEFKTLNPAEPPKITSVVLNDIKDNKAKVHYVIQTPEFNENNRRTVIENISVRDSEGNIYGSIDNSKEEIPNEGEFKIKLKPNQTYEDLFLTVTWNDGQILNEYGSLPSGEIEKFTTDFSYAVIYGSTTFIILFILLLILTIFLIVRRNRNKKRSSYHLGK